jgi:hypothetical protein
MKTHWKKQFNYDYLGAYSLLPNQDMTLTIKETKKEMVTGTGGQKDQCFICYFEEDVKPMILNKTNCKVIENLYTPFVEDWPGKKVTVYAQKVKAFGEETEALRIRPEHPKAAPELLPDTDKWNKAVEYLKGTGTLENIKKNYTISEENESKLLEAAL